MCRKSSGIRLFWWEIRELGVGGKLPKSLFCIYSWGLLASLKWVILHYLWLIWFCPDFHISGWWKQFFPKLLRPLHVCSEEPKCKEIHASKPESIWQWLSAESILQTTKSWTTIFPPNRILQSMLLKGSWKLKTKYHAELTKIIALGLKL